MKNLLFSALVLGSAVAMAEQSATTSNVIGILRVDSSAAETIVSVPWVSETGGAMTADKVVKVDNLNVGDELMYYNATEQKYQCWVLQENAGIRTWAPATEVSSEGVTKESDSNETPIPVGGVIVLKRYAPNGGSIGSCFYLYGQVPTGASATSTAAAGTTEAACWTLLAPPPEKIGSDGTIAFSSIRWENCNDGDEFRFKRNATDLILTLTYKKETGWTYRNQSVAGIALNVYALAGMWYKNCGSSAAIVTW